MNESFSVQITAENWVTLKNVIVYTAITVFPKVDEIRI